MNPHEKETIIQDLYAKHGQTPLVQLVRRLVVAIDQTQLGTEHRRQTMTLLGVLTGQVDLPSNTSAWIDWVETNGDALDWDRLMAAKTEKNEYQAPRRLSVEIPEEPRGEGRPRPMTREQMIWDEALKRSENKSWKPSLAMVMVIIPSFLLCIGYLGYKKNWITLPATWPNSLSSLVSAFQSNPPKNEDAITGSPTPVEIYWGRFQPQQNPIPKDDYMAYLSESLSLYPELKRTQLSHWQKQTQLNPHQKLWTRLLIQEHTFSSPMRKVSSNNFSLRSLGTGSRQWQAERRGPSDQSQKFSHVEQIQLSEGKGDISIKRAFGQDGVAHRIILSSKGLLAWSWRLKWQGLVLDGQLVRRSNPDRFNIKTTLPKGEVAFQIPIDPHQVFLPAVFSPSLLSFSDVALIHPISGIISSSELFDRNVKVQRDLETGELTLSDPTLHWQESWTPQQP